MKKKEKIHLIKRTIFPYDILFSFDTKENTVKYIKNKLEYDLDLDEEKSILKGENLGRTVQFKNSQILVWVKEEKTKRGFCVCTAVHELSHAVFYILETINIPIDEKTSEVFAYYMGYLTREILDRFDK